jgi:hypothetical protein
MENRGVATGTDRPGEPPLQASTTPNVARRCAAAVVVLLLAAACDSAPSVPGGSSPIAPVAAHVPRETAERFATSIARAAWKHLHRLPKQQAISNIHAQLQAFSDMTGCSIAVSHRQQFSAAEHPGFIHAFHRNVVGAVKCP